MKGVRVYLLLLCIGLPSIIFSNDLKFFGIEIGASYNTLFWSSPFYILTPGANSVNRTEFFVTPTVRTKYNIKIKDNYSIHPFLGYHQFGGKKESGQYKINALEAGLFLNYYFKVYSVGAGVQSNYIIKSIYKSNYFNFEEDRSDWFENFSYNIGFRLSYTLKKFEINIESWFGLNNLADGPIKGATVRENNYKILIGYWL